MCKEYDICSCDEALALLEALERAWAEIPLGATRADAILKKALDTHHSNVIRYIEESE